MKTVLRYWLCQVYENEDQEYPPTPDLWEPPLQKLCEMIEAQAAMGVAPWESFPGIAFRKASECHEMATNLYEQGTHAVRLVHLDDEEITYLDVEGNERNADGTLVTEENRFKATI